MKRETQDVILNCILAVVLIAGYVAIVIFLYGYSPFPANIAFIFALSVIAYRFWLK